MRIYMNDDISGKAQIFTKSPNGMNPKKCRRTCEKNLKVSESIIAKGNCHHGPKSLKER
jgi:hypothetical protein